jgi:hypothetical protein
VSTWTRTERAIEADAAAERLLAVHARCDRLAGELARRGDAAAAAELRSIAAQAVAGHPPVRIHFAALALGISHAEAVALTRDGTLPPAPWTGQLRVRLPDLALLIMRSTHDEHPPASTGVRRSPARARAAR